MEIPNWREYVPVNDSILLQKINNSKPFAQVYLFLVEKIKKQQIQFRSKDLVNAFHMNYGYAYQMLDIITSLGYFKKIHKEGGRGTQTYFIFNTSFERGLETATKNFINKKFLDEAKKKCENVL